MKIPLFILVIIVMTVGYSAVSFYIKVRISRALVAHAVPYSLKGERTMSVLVLGDSTAVGVGTVRPEESLAGLLSDSVHATSVDNFAVSGARVRDLAKQVQQLKKEKYNYILVGIGSNDVVRFGNAVDAAEHLGIILSGLPKHDHMIVYMAGNLGATQLFPRSMNPSYTNRSLDFHDTFARAVTAAGGAYVNLYVDPAVDPFVQEPARYLAADGFHPSSLGYALWFEKIRGVLTP